MQKSVYIQIRFLVSFLLRDNGELFSKRDKKKTYRANSEGNFD